MIRRHYFGGSFRLASRASGDVILKKISTAKNQPTTRPNASRAGASRS
jgi:hypothetical protein